MTKTRRARSQRSMLNLLLASVCLVARLSAQSSVTSIDFLTKPTLIECDAGGGEPCFRLTFGFVDSDGKFVSVPIPRAEELPSRIEMQVDGDPVTPYYAAAVTHTGKQATRPQIAMLLFDISGSMLNRDLGGQTRFDAAKSAASEYLRNFTDGRDRVAIAPFASRGVLQIVGAARFVSTRMEAQAELDALPQPEARNNTALYSAVSAAIETLQRARGGAEQLRLLVLTDGSNDVQPRSGDDAGLLAGASGLAAASSAVEHSGVDVLPIGLGSRQSLDEAALARLGTQPPLITSDLASLRKAFLLPQAAAMESVTVTIKAPRSLGSRSLLAGRLLRFRAKLTLSDGTIVVENRPAVWVAPPVATPLFSGEASEAEQRSYISSAHVGQGSAWLVARTLAVFAGFAAMLALLWFALPRWIWPERYDTRSARPLRPEYWPGTESALPGKPSLVAHPAPPGFEPRGKQARAPVRHPGENTIVRPAPDFASTKTRLN